MNFPSELSTIRKQLKFYVFPDYICLIAVANDLS